jgi:hypothetical protein
MSQTSPRFGGVTRLLAFVEGCEELVRDGHEVLVCREFVRV